MTHTTPHTATRTLPAAHALSIVTAYGAAFLALATAAALAGHFSVWLTLGYGALGATLLWSSRGTRLRATLVRHARIIALFAALGAVVTLVTEPTIFTGRDQGSIANAAILLAKNHGLTNRTDVSDTFFAYYGPGKALNFPGFYYATDGALTSQFPLPYTVWLATWYGLAGMGGFAIANGILLAFFGLTLVVLARMVAPADIVGARRRATIAAAALTIASFTTVWFAKHTLTENLAQALLLALIMQLLLLLAAARRGNARMTAVHYWLMLGCGTLLTFTRIEGIAFFGIAALAFLVSRDGALWLRDRFFSHVIVPAVGFLFLLAIAFSASTGFYKSVIKALIGIGDAAPSAAGMVGAIVDRYAAYTVYGVLPLLVAGALGVAWFVRRRRFGALLPLAVAAPALLYLFSAQISADAPWMLRRLSFAAVPMGILYAAVGWSVLVRQRTRILTAAALGACMLPAAILYLPYAENRGLLFQTKAFGDQFVQDDLILIDRTATGDGFAMIAGPLQTVYDKNAAYIFNPADLARVDFRAYRNVFLVAPATEAARYSTDLSTDGLLFVERGHVTFDLDHLARNNNPWRMARREHKTTDVTIYRVMPR